MIKIISYIKLIIKKKLIIKIIEYNYFDYLPKLMDRSISPTEIIIDFRDYFYHRNRIILFENINNDLKQAFKEGKKFIVIRLKDKNYDPHNYFDQIMDLVYDATKNNDGSYSLELSSNYF